MDFLYESAVSKPTSHHPIPIPARRRLHLKIVILKNRHSKLQFLPPVHISIAGTTQQVQVLAERGAARAT